ncbi:MAG: hypothetical protein K9L98_00285 [Candidatus Pacebacteria bacterium]|nr:hypothetical protein [Candidatus Paceibacterota bacterium]MCF7862440.1 hypothetical protein [Candidatus Paceibacterota bacterium]
MEGTTTNYNQTKTIPTKKPETYRKPRNPDSPQENIDGEAKPEPKSVNEKRAEVLKIFNNQENGTKKKEVVKEGVDFVFQQNPELANIGTIEQYSKYIDTIFPESKLKDIVYHGTKTYEDLIKHGFSKDFSGKSNRGDKSGYFYFTNSLENAEYTGISERNIDQYAKKIEYIHEIFNTTDIPTTKEIYQNIGDLKNKLKKLEEDINDLSQKRNIFTRKKRHTQIETHKKEAEILKEQIDFLYNEGVTIADNYHQGVNYLKGEKGHNSVNPLNAINHSKTLSGKFKEVSQDKIVNILFGTEDLKYSPKVLSIVLDMRDPIIRDLGYSDKDENPLLKNKTDPEFYEYNNKQAEFLDDFNKSENDSAIQKNMFDVLLSNVYITKKAEQIHILGSDQDINDFKDFVKNN